MLQRHIFPHQTIREFSGFSTDLDLEALSPDGETPARALWIVDAGGGNLLVEMDDRENVSFTDLTAGEYVQPSPAYFRKILASGTSEAVQVTQIDDPAGTPAYLDLTTEFNDTTANDVLFPASEAIGDQIAIGFWTPFSGVSIDVGTAGVGGTITNLYWNGSAWADPTDTDGTSHLTTDGNITFSPPADWAALSINGGPSLYFMVIQVATVFSTNPLITSGAIIQTPTDLGKVRAAW